MCFSFPDKFRFNSPTVTIIEPYGYTLYGTSTPTGNQIAFHITEEIEQSVSFQLQVTGIRIPNEIGIQTQTLSINDWKDQFKKNNFKNIEHIQVGEKDDWSGTLIISAFKN